MTPGTFTPCPSHLTVVRTYRFRYGSGLQTLSLAKTANSPPRFSKRMAQPRSSPLVLPPHDGFLQGESTLSGCAGLSPPSFRLFSPPFRGTFQHSLTVLIRYRSQNVFRVGSRCLPSSRAISNARYSRHAATPQLTPTGLSPSTAPRSRGFRLPWVGSLLHVNPHLPWLITMGFSSPFAVFDRL